jgi:hypothetical protein
MAKSIMVTTRERVAFLLETYPFAIEGIYEMAFVSLLNVAISNYNIKLKNVNEKHLIRSRSQIDCNFSKDEVFYPFDELCFMHYETKVLSSIRDIVIECTFKAKELTMHSKLLTEKEANDLIFENFTLYGMKKDASYTDVKGVTYINAEVPYTIDENQNKKFFENNPYGFCNSIIAIATKNYQPTLKEHNLKPFNKQKSIIRK